MMNEAPVRAIEIANVCCPACGRMLRRPPPDVLATLIGAVQIVPCECGRRVEAMFATRQVIAGRPERLGPEAP